MLIKSSDRETKTRIAMRDGPGSVLIKDICSKEELYEKNRLFAQMTLKKGCGIGYHEHSGEKEIFLINSGKAVYNDDGNEIVVNAGDVLICEDGHGHAITNISEEDCELVALIVLN
jgi:quercetin dioxygenase-like cupin family protein